MTTQTPEQLPKLPSAEQRSVYESKAKAELDRLNARISEFKAKAEQAKADAEISYYDTVEELTAQRDALLMKWEEMNSAGEAAWKDLQTGFETAWNELTRSFERATRHFNS
ncbi:MAG: hypothetical protein AAF609_21195 [Cyanobacteria bacterium P01_C01_bin.120]